MNNPSVKEIQLNSNGEPTEVSYNPKSTDGIMLALSGGIALSDECEMISMSSDGIVLVYGGRIDEHHEDYYATKIKGDNILYKHYLREFWNLPNIQLPKGSRLANQFGIGYYPLLMGTSNEKYDMYFFCDNQKAIESYYGKTIGGANAEELHYYKYEKGLYGVTYTKDLEVLNLKRYLYPLDPYCKNPSYI
jgi:hypothetical protein